MAAENNTSEQPQTDDSPVEIEEISLDVDGTNPSAEGTPLSPSTDDPSSPTKEQDDDSTAKATVQGETSSPVAPSPPTDESTTGSPPAAAAEAEASPSAPSKKRSPSGEAYRWLQLQYHDDQRTKIKTPKDIEDEGIPSPSSQLDPTLFDRVHGSIAGMAIGDALGAHVEFRPHSYLVEHPVKDFSEGGTWGLKKGQFTDDTSMALCLSSSLIERNGMDLYDQLVKYKWWFREGYMSSTGHCFDIGAATSQSVCEFEKRQKHFAREHKIEEEMDTVDPSTFPAEFDVNCSEEGVAGNGALMRLAPVPLFFYLHPREAIDYAGQSGRITHGDVKARDACRYYAALIVAAVHGCGKEKLLSRQFYANNRDFFGTDGLVEEIEEIAKGSFRKKGGYDDGIRGKGYIVPALEAALWAFWSTKTFAEGALAAVNLGDDTDTTAAIYGQLAGAVYGYQQLDAEQQGVASWKEHVYAKGFLRSISEWLLHEGTQWKANEGTTKQLVTDFQIDADEREESPSDQPLAQSTTTGATEVTPSVHSSADPLPPASAEVSADVGVSPVPSPEEQPAPPSLTTSEPTTTEPVKGSEEEVSSPPPTSGESNTTPPQPSAAAAPSADTSTDLVPPAAEVSVPPTPSPTDDTTPPAPVTQEEAPADAAPAVPPPNTPGEPEAVAAVAPADPSTVG